MKDHNTRISMKAFAAHQDPYMIACLVNCMRGRQGFTCFHFPLQVTSDGRVCGATQRYTSNVGDWAHLNTDHAVLMPVVYTRRFA